MSKILFRNVRVTDLHSKHNNKKVDVLVSEGKIETIAKAGTLEADRNTTHNEGGCLSPGWVDMRSILSDPGQEWKEDISSLARAAATGGFTSVLCLPETQPAMDHRDSIASLVTRSRNLPVNLLPCGNLTAGGKGKDLAELYDMQQAGAVAFSDGQHPIKDPGSLLRALQYLSAFDGTLISLPYEASVDVGGLMAEGETSTRLGMKGIPSIAEELCISRDLSVLNYQEFPLHIGPVTTPGGVRMIRSGKRKFSSLTAETSALYLLLDDKNLEKFETVYKVFPPLRPADEVRSLRRAVLDGVIDVISSNHHPQSVEEKNMEFSAASFGASGLETAFAAAWTAMSEEKMDLAELVEKFTANPRRILKLAPVTIAEGEKAELTWFDEKEEWTVEVKDLKSKSRYNPLVGRNLKGKVKGIVAKGKWVAG